MKLTLSPSSSEVYYDNKYIGRGTQTFKVASGKHRVTVKHDGYGSKSFDVDITEDQVKSYRASLSRLDGNQSSEKKSDLDAAARLEKDGKYEEALALYRRLLNKNSGDCSALLGKARCIRAGGDNDKALTAYLEAARAAENQKAMEAMLEALEGVLEINPNYLTVRYKRGLYFLEQAEYYRAAQDFEKVVQIDRRHLNAYYNLGEAYYRSGNYAGAIAAYENIQQLNFADPKPYAYMAKAYYRLNDLKKTKKCYEKFEQGADITTKNSFRSDPEWLQIKAKME